MYLRLSDHEFHIEDLGEDLRIQVKPRHEPYRHDAWLKDIFTLPSSMPFDVVIQQITHWGYQVCRPSSFDTTEHMREARS